MSLRTFTQLYRWGSPLFQTKVTCHKRDISYTGRGINKRAMLTWVSLLLWLLVGLELNIWLLCLTPLSWCWWMLWPIYPGILFALLCISVWLPKVKSCIFIACLHGGSTVIPVNKSPLPPGPLAKTAVVRIAIPQLPCSTAGITVSV